jgi:hypothetical protein
MVVNNSVNGTVVKMLLSVLFFASVLSVTAYACEINHCSDIACSHDSDCFDSCDGSFWMYGDDDCSYGCRVDGQKYCGFQYKVCADADEADGVPNKGGSVRVCGAACDQDSDSAQVESTCYFDCNTNSCGYEDSCSLESHCDGNVRYYDGSCSETGCSFENQDCSELPTQLTCNIYNGLHLR